MSAIRKMLRTVRVTELVKYVKKAVKSTSFQIGSNMRLRIHYDPVAETCGIVIDEDGSKDEPGNKKLFIPCRSVAEMGATWSHYAYRIAFIMEYRTAAVMNKAAKLLGNHYGVQFRYQNMNPYAVYLLSEVPDNAGTAKEAVICAEMRKRFISDFPEAETRLEECRRKGKSYAKEYFVICDKISKMERSVNQLYTNLASEKERFPSLHEYEKFKRYWRKIYSITKKINEHPRIVNT